MGFILEIFVFKVRQLLFKSFRLRSMNLELFLTLTCVNAFGNDPRISLHLTNE